MFKTVWKKLTTLAREHPAAIILVAAYVVLGVFYSVVNPIHEATDELRHYRYVRYIADLGQLPVQSGEAGNAQAHHPPLYYATAALFSFPANPSDPLYEPAGNPHWGFRNWEVGVDNKNYYQHGPDEAWPYRDASLAAHLSRWVTIAWGAGAVALTYAIVLLLFPERKVITALATGIVAFNPMFIYLGAAVNNDVPAGLAGAAVTYGCLLVLRDGYTNRRALLLGVLYGLALLVKFNLLAMLGVIELALLLAVLFPPDTAQENPRKGWLLTLIKANGIILLVAFVLAGWWYIRNTMLYGEPTGFLTLTEIWGVRNPTTGVELLWPELRYAWTSLWARFGYGQIPISDIYYNALAIFCGAGFAGLFIYWLFKGKQITRQQWMMYAVLAVAFIVNLLVLIAYIMVSPAGAMGRFFFPGLSAFAGLVASGWLTLIPRRFERAIGSVLLVLLACLPLVALLGYIAPAYATPQSIPVGESEPITVFGEHIRVLDYEVSQQKVLPGDQIDVTVTWQVIQPTDVPYAVFVHLINQQKVIVAQRDTFTGLGNYPSQWWKPGHTFTETYRIYVPEAAYTPETAYIQIGLYNAEHGRLAAQSGDVQDGALRLAEIEIATDPDADYPNQTYINFSDRFALLGYTIDPRAVEPGDEITLTLFWQALDPDTDYYEFTQVLEGWDVYASMDGPPVVATIYTRLWERGEVYREERTLTVSPETPTGSYEIWVGWFFPDGDRLAVIADDGRILEGWHVLGNIRVEADE